MKIELYNDPVPHIIIDETFNEQQYKKVWDEIQYLSPKMRGPEQTHAARDIKNLPDGSTEFAGFKKRGTGVFLDSFFVNQSDSDIRRVYDEVFSDVNLFNEVYKQNPAFLILKNVNHGSTLVQKYKDGDEYDSHKDSCVFSMVTLLYKEPKVYSGGDFCFTEFDQTYVVPLSNNQTIIFPSAASHKVSKVISESDKSEDCRYTVSTFMGISGNKG
jgi:hypothetical protein